MGQIDLKHIWTEWRENLEEGLPKAEADNSAGRFEYSTTF